MKYMKDFISHFSSVPAFTTNEARRFLKYRGASEGYHKLVINNLLKSHKVHKITRGAYTFFEEVQYSGFAFRPFYYGLEDALSILGAWEQETNPVILTPRKVRPGLRAFEGRNYLVRHIDRKLFFGYYFKPYGQFNIPVSTPEKTLIDLFYFRIRVPDGVVENIIGMLNLVRMNEYLSLVSSNLQYRIEKVLPR